MIPAPDPFFSIVIPVYNRFPLLLATVESIRGQTFTSFEIIIVNDGSTDGSADKIDSVYRDKERFTVLHQPNLERGAARNAGFRVAKGNYVIFLDSDDILLPGHLRVLHAKITEQHSPDFIATKFEFQKNGKRVPSDISGLKEGFYDYRLFLNGNPLACNICVRRNNPRLLLFEEDRRYAVKEDWMFLIRNLHHQRLYIAGEVTLLMLDHEARSMKGDNPALIRKTFLARDWILEHVPLKPGEREQLNAHVHYFCAIHSYLERDKKAGLEYIRAAARYSGWKKKYLLLFLKLLIGRRILSLIKPAS